MLTLFVPLDARRARHRVARLELRVPQERVRDARSAASTARSSRRRRCSCRTAWARSPARIASGRVPARAARRRLVVELDQSDVDPRRRAGRDRVRVPRGRVPRRTTPAPRPARDGRVLPPRARSSPQSSPAWSRSWASSCCVPTRRYLFDGLDVACAPRRDRVRPVRRAVRCGCCSGRDESRVRSRSARLPPSSSDGVSRSGRTCCRETLKVSQAAAPTPRSRRSSSCSLSPRC